MTVTTDPAATTPTPEATEDQPSRRWLNLGMMGALVAAYGTLAAYIARYLYPATPRPRAWLYVAEANSINAGEAVVFRTPTGEPVNVTRQGEGDDAIVALSSTCPHLGCQVHWESQNDRFFCPCHNGVFDPSGVATEGPPAEAGQSLLQYPIKVEGGLLYIELPTDVIAMGPGRIEEATTAYACCPPGPGHDPCLYPSESLATKHQLSLVAESREA